MSSYDGEPHDIFGYLYGTQWKDLTPEQIISLESGNKFDTDIEILVANEEIKDTIELFFQNKIDKFAWKDVGRLKLIYTLVRLSNQLPTEFS